MSTANRTMWKDVLPGWRHAHRAANHARASIYARQVLEAVLFLLAAYQRTGDTFRLTQVAREAGRWDGEGTCPDSAAASVGRQLKALAAMGAIHYTPSRERGGCFIGLLTPNQIQAIGDPHKALDGRVESRDQVARQDRRSKRKSRATRSTDTGESSRDQIDRQDDGVARPEPSVSRDQFANVARSARECRAIRSTASEGFPEDVVRGEEPEGGDAASDSADAPPSDARRTGEERTPSLDLIRTAINLTRWAGDHPNPDPIVKKLITRLRRTKPTPEALAYLHEQLLEHEQHTPAATEQIITQAIAPFGHDF